MASGCTFVQSKEIKVIPNEAAVILNEVKNLKDKRLFTPTVIGAQNDINFIN